MTTAELIDAGREWGKPLTEADARELTAQIRTSVQELLPKIRTAYRRRADLALGYAGWDEYCDAELTGLRLPLGDRAEAVTTLRGDGMSQRAIGSALGISAATVNRTLATVSSETVPERITGTDGREQPATRPTPTTPGPSDAAVTPPVDPGATPAPAAPVPPDPQEPAQTPEHYETSGWTGGDSGSGVACACGVQFDGFDSLKAAGEELARHIETPEPGSAPSTAPSGSGPGGEVASTREGGDAAAPPVTPTLRLVPTADEKRAAEQRDARGLLRRAVEILAPAHDRPGYAETWARQLGPYDDELSELCRRATEAIATLDALIEGCGQ